MLKYKWLNYCGDNKMGNSNIYNIMWAYPIEYPSFKNPVKNAVDSKLILSLMNGKTYNMIILYAYFKRYDEINILYDIFKSSKLITQNLIIENIIKYYNLDCLAINPSCKSDNKYKLWNDINIFKFTSTYPQFLLNFCGTLNGEQFFNIISALLRGYIIKRVELINDQINFIKLLICCLDKNLCDDINLKHQIELLIDEYLNNDCINVELLKCLCELCKDLVYNSFKYIQCVLPKDVVKSVNLMNNTDKLSNNELFKLLIPCSIKSYNLWCSIKKYTSNEYIYIEKMKGITEDMNLFNIEIGIKYVFDGINKKIFKCGKNIGEYLMFVLKCFNKLPIREVVNIGKNIVDYIVEIGGMNKLFDEIGICDIMKELLDKSMDNIIIKCSVEEYETLLDYYLSTVNARNLVRLELVKIMVSTGMTYNNTSHLILIKNGIINDFITDNHNLI